MGTQDRIARIANRQYGVVTRSQLLAVGVTAREIKRRTESGVLLRVHRGVYRVGHGAPSVEATYLAAVLACGPGAVLCGRAAAHLYGLVKGRPLSPEVMTRTERRVAGIGTHRCRAWNARHTTAHRRIPITTVPRTLVALAATLEPDELARSCHEAGVRYRTTPRQVEAVMMGLGGKVCGAEALRDVLRGDTKVTLSRLEARFLDVLRDAGLPLPITNRPAGGRRVDCRWPEHRLTVELQSYRYHNSRHSWEQDHVRRREARARGDAFGTYTWDDVEHPAALLRELRPVLFGPPIPPP